MVLVIPSRLPLDRELYMTVLSTEVVLWHEKRGRAFVLQVLLSSCNPQVADGSGDPERPTAGPGIKSDNTI